MKLNQKMHHNYKERPDNDLQTGQKYCNHGTPHLDTAVGETGVRWWTKKGQGQATGWSQCFLFRTVLW